MRRDSYLDQEERRYGRMVEAQTVHHIFPAGDYPEYAWEDWNLISLTNANHDRMHDRTTNELTACGVELLCRTARKYGIPIPAKYGGGESNAT